MNIRIEFPLALAAIALLLPGCAANQNLSSRDRAAIHRVAVSHAMSIAGQQSASTTDQVAGRVLRHGASYGLGALGLGLVGSLAMDAADLATPSKKEEISPVALRILAEARTDPGELLGARMERELARNGYVVDSKTPDAVFHFELEKLTMVPADDLKLRNRPVLGVRATLLGAKGKILWRHSASEVSDTASALTWHEYSSQPRRFRAEFDKLAERIAAHFVAELKR